MEINTAHIHSFQKVYSQEYNLSLFAHTLLYTMNTPEYWEWLATAPEQEIIDWAEEYEKLAQEVI